MSQNLSSAALVIGALRVKKVNFKRRCDSCVPVNCIEIQTRTHLMARHRKSPRSRRNLMVIDTLTPSQGHEFDRRFNFFSVS